MRDRNLLAGLPFDAPLPVLDLAEHYHATADALEKCGRLLCTLKIQHYWGDYGLKCPPEKQFPSANSPPQLVSNIIGFTNNGTLVETNHQVSEWSPGMSFRILAQSW